MDEHSYQEVVERGAKGLNVRANPAELLLVVSSGLVVDAPLHDGNAWTLGGYVQEVGGVSARCKKTFGIYLPVDDEEEHSVCKKGQLQPHSVLS